MPKLEKSNSYIVYEIEYAIDGLENTDIFKRFLDSLHILFKALKLTSFNVIQDGGNSNLYSYEFETQDSRMWAQTLLKEGNDFRQTFDVPSPGFLLKEFEQHRNVRNLVQEIITKHNLTKIEIVWP